MRIGIDCYSLQAPESAGRGIGRYGRDLVRAILDSAPDDEFLLYAIDAMDVSGIPTAANARTRLIPAAARTNRFTSKALDSFIFPNPDDLDALLILSPLQSHVETPTQIPRVVSVVDHLIPENLPAFDSPEPAYQEAYETYLSTVREYDAILTMSRSAKADLVRLRGFDPEKITVVGAAANPLFGLASSDAEREEDRRLLKALGVYEPGYVLNVGHEGPRNGSRILATAFSQLPNEVRAATRLVFAYQASEAHREEIRSYAVTRGMPGASGDPDLLREPGMSPAVLFTGWCDDLSLRALYRNAAVTAFAAVDEGFGLPILEAMACGCAVACGANSAQLEVFGDVGLPFNAECANQITEVLYQVLTDRELQQGLGSRGVEVASRYSWRDVAERVLRSVRADSTSLR